MLPSFIKMKSCFFFFLSPELLHVTFFHFSSILDSYRVTEQSGCSVWSTNEKQDLLNKVWGLIGFCCCFLFIFCIKSERMQRVVLLCFVVLYFE